MFKWIVAAVVYTALTVIGLLLSWEAKRYYTNNRERIFKCMCACKDTWLSNAPIKK